MSTLAIILSSIIFFISSWLVISFSIKEHAYLKNDDKFMYVWFIAMDWLLICGFFVGLWICLPIMIFV